jgi:superfamily II DNA or RNA helicase
MSGLNWRTEFLSQYPEAPGRKSLLLAPTGSGKTALCTRTMRAMLNRRLVDTAVILVDGNLLHQQWLAAA